VSLDREGYLTDKSVTPFPLDGWDYVAVDGDYDETDGVRIRCGEGDTDGEGCGETYYLNFVRYEAGREVPVRPVSELVHLAPEGPRDPWEPGGPGR
jgi:hypothetical protein